MPLGVTIRSAIERLDPCRRMNLFVLDGGLTEDSRARLSKACDDLRVSIEWLHPDVEAIRDLPVSDHISVAAYLRLLMPALLPQDVTRLIYLDADMLVRRDLAELWAESQGTHAVLAVQDMAAPYLDAATSLPGFGRCHRHLAAMTPIPNFRELGLPRDAEYFNSGLLVVDLAQWRRERYAEQVLDCLREHREHVLWWDQYALNVVLAGKWRALDRRWNQGANIYHYPNWQESPWDRQTFTELRESPWIVHFCSPSKPWHYFCRHPFAGEFRRCVSRTGWKDWRPERPDDFLRLWWRCHYGPLRRQLKLRRRAMMEGIGLHRRWAA
jgi:lipopolysaccharide biosynthesis glycosyltransferase